VRIYQLSRHVKETIWIKFLDTSHTHTHTHILIFLKYLTFKNILVQLKVIEI